MTDKYAVFGNPIKHSRSPQIHSAFARATGQDISYRAHKVEAGKFADAASSFFSNDGKGLNITVPFKVDAFKFADTLSSRAQRAGAVNTLRLSEGGQTIGDNTDGVGLVTDICNNLQWQIKDRRVLLLGAGGAIRGILEPIIERNPKLLVIVNRTVAKAQALAAEFSDIADVRACSFEALQDNQFDLIINGTSASLAGKLPPLPSNLISDDGCCYDMMYSAEPTPFMRWGAENLAWAVSDGLGMLVEQAAESFNLWRGMRPETQLIIDDIRAEMESS